MGGLHRPLPTGVLAGRADTHKYIHHGTPKGKFTWFILIWGLKLCGYNLLTELYVVLIIIYLSRADSVY